MKPKKPPAPEPPEEFASVMGAARKAKLEVQPQGSHFQNRLLPDQVSNIQISGGQNIPYSYYLGANNTVPFIRIENPYTQKELSWGEIIRLPPGQSANIRNVSYMPGDLQLQSGDWPSAGPRRITVPVEVAFQNIGNDVLGWTRCYVKYPCDTRRARRAYFVFEYSNEDPIPTPPLPPLRVDAFISARFQQHTKNAEMPWLEAYSEHYQFLDVKPNVIPLGTSHNGGPMRLADYANIYLDVEYDALLHDVPPNDQTDGFPSVVHIINAFYVLEY